ncbi:MAG TPA: STAS domain-containing protein [Planctomycetota bacterium]|nr:STAS domain-containing protein [Planctomycetota bacterium]
MIREQPTVVSLDGDVDFASRKGVREKLLGAVGPGRPLLLVDLSGCGAVDSEGLAALLSVAQAIHERGGVMKFCSPSPFVERLFHVTRLGLVFEVHRDRRTALESF